MKKFATKLATATTVVLLGLGLAVPVLALGVDARAEVRADIRDDRAGSRPGLLQQVFNKRGRAAIGSGTLKTKSGDTVPATLVVTRDNKDYTINVDANTQLRRRFWGKATLSEFTVGDTLNVIGQWADDGHTTINAKLVRDASIQKRFGVFVGEVTSLTSGGWVISTVHRGSQTVTISGSTKLVNRKGEAIAQTDVKVGHKLRVRGLWDSKANTITEVTHVKDYSLPVKTTTP